MSDFLTRRGSAWHFVRRVPAEFAKLDRRVIIRNSTGVKIADDRIGRRAAGVAQKLNEELERFWEALAHGRSTATGLYEAARRRARQLGFDYIANGDLIGLAAEKRRERLEALATKRLAHDPGEREDLLGTVAPSSFKLSRLLDEYEAATRDEVKDLSSDQLRIWRNGRIHAVARLVKILGDKPVAELTHADAIDYSE